MSLFKGVATALITPFDKKGVDKTALIKQIEFQIKHNVDALVILGTTGEASVLSQNERDLIIATTVEAVAKRVPIIVGTGSNDTVKAIEYSKQAQSLGADGLLVVTPYYNKCTQNGLISHYTKISDSVNIPIILYTVPSRTNVNITPKTLHKLSKIDNIVALKDASGDLLQMQDYNRCIPNGFDIYCGDDGLMIPYYSQNATGIISVLSNLVPNCINSVYDYCKRNDYKNANIEYQKIHNLIKTVFLEPNPIGIKTAMRLVGKDSGIIRLPLCRMSKQNTNRLKKELTNHFELDSMLKPF